MASNGESAVRCVEIRDRSVEGVSPLPRLCKESVKTHFKNGL